MKYLTLLPLTFLCGVLLQAAEPNRSNVLFIAADDLACTLGCYGDPMAKTPNLDRLAAEGVCFLNAYNQIPLCNPSRASVMTGLRPDRIKVYDLDRHFRDEVPDVVTLSQRFKNSGWYTARVGKIFHYNVPASNCPVPHYGLDQPVLRKAIQAYYASVSFVDAQVGRLLDALDELGLADNTLVVFWSDHGYHLGEHHGVWQKRTLFEQGARAPLLFRAPKVKGNGQPCRRIVEFVDIYPTVVDWAGLPSPNNLDGRSLMPLLREPTKSWNGMAVTQILRPADGRLKTQVMGCSIRTDRWRFTEWANGECGVELYDHHSDPMEFRNLAVDPDADAKKIIERLRPELRKRASGRIPTVPVNPKRL